MLLVFTATIFVLGALLDITVIFCFSRKKEKKIQFPNDNTIFFPSQLLGFV